MTTRIASLLIGAVFAYGLAQTQPWAHPAWTHTGWERFILVMAVTAVLSFHRWLLYGAVLVVAFSVGIQPVLGLAFVLLGALNLGWLLFHQKDDRLNLLAGFAIYVFLFSLTASLPINTIWLWGALLASPIAIARRFAFPLPQPNWPVALPLVANFLLALKPEVSADGLSQHFAIVKWVQDFGRFHFDAAHQIWAVQPMAGDWALSIANLIGGEYAARLLNFTWLLVLTSFVYSALRRRVEPRAAALIAGIFAATPLLQLTSTSLFIENFWATMIVGALFAIEEGEVMLAATLAGASGASKLLGLTPAPALAVYALWKVRPKPARAVAAAAIFFAIAIIPYARAYWITGNPVFHYANAIFKSPLYRTDQNFADLRYPPRLTWHTLYDLTFHTDQFVESEPGTAGYQWFWFLPLALLAIRRGTAFERAALATALSVVILIFSRQASLRYVEVAMPLLVIAFAPVAAAVERSKVAYGIGLALLALNLYEGPASAGFHRSFCLIPYSSAERHEYLAREAPVRLLIDEMNRVAPGAAVANFEDETVAGLRAMMWTVTWHTPKFNDLLLTTRSVEEYVSLLRDFKTEYVIAPRPGDWNYLQDSPLEVFLEAATDPVATAGTLQLAKLKTQIDRLELPTAPRGEYDDANARIRYDGAWLIHQRFADAANGTVSYSADPKAAVRFRFDGTKITYVFTKAFNRGEASIEIDGVSKGTIEMRSTEPQWQARAVFEDLGPGAHEIVIRNVGGPGTFIDVDQLIVE